MLHGMNSWMSSCNSAHMASNLMRWWRSKFYKGYKPFTVESNIDSPVSDSEELLGKSLDYRISCTTPPLAPPSSIASSPISTNLHSTQQPLEHHLNLQEFSCDVSLEQTPNQNLQDRQEFSFTLYDFDGHGKITKDDIAGLVTTIYEALGSSIKVPHCGSKTIKVKLTVSPDQRKHVSTAIVNNQSNTEETPLEQKLNFNVTIKRGTTDRKKISKEPENKKHYCCRKLNEEPEAAPDNSDECSDICSRMSAEIATMEDDCDPLEDIPRCTEQQKCEQRYGKNSTLNLKNECDIKKHRKSFLHTKKVKKRSGAIQKQDGIELHSNVDSNNSSFHTPRKLIADHVNVENNQLPQYDIQHHRHRHHRPIHSYNAPLRCLANVDPTHFYVDLMALQNNTQISNGGCHYDKLVDAVMCVSNKKLSECCKRHNNQLKNCDDSNTPFHCQLLQNSTKQNKSGKKQTKKQCEFEPTNMLKKNIRKFPRVVLGHTSSPHHLRHRNRQEDQARAMAQVVRWLEQEFSNNLHRNTGDDKSKSNNCEESGNKKHSCGMSNNLNYNTEYHEHHHVHEHIHHHYHHYQEPSVV